MFTETFPILLVADVQRSLRFYRDLVGVTEEFRFPDKGDPVYVGLQLGASHLGIGLNTDEFAAGRARSPENGHPFELWAYAEDCDAAIEMLRANGVDVIQEPENQPWGERIARVLDPDGNRVIVASR